MQLQKDQRFTQVKDQMREREREKGVLPFCLEGKNWPKKPSDFTRSKQKWRKERERDELGTRPGLESRNSPTGSFELGLRLNSGLFFFFLFLISHIFFDFTTFYFSPLNLNFVI